MTHNKEEIDVKKLIELLQSISKYADTKIKIYALGGTALTLLNIKKSTLDIDINIETNKEYEYISKLFEQIGFEKVGGIRWITQEGFAFDVFRGSNILGTDLLPDCLNLSKFINSFGYIELYTLSLQDIIISKLSRGDSRDFEDIEAIFRKEKINLQELVDRYKKTMELSIVSEYKQKLLDLIEIQFREWKFPLDLYLINEVKKW